jgi:hypothetical protein
MIWNLFTRFLDALATKLAALSMEQCGWSIGVSVFAFGVCLIYDKIITHRAVQAQRRAGRERGGHGWIDSDPHAPWSFLMSFVVSLLTFTVSVLLVH